MIHQAIKCGGAKERLADDVCTFLSIGGIVVFVLFEELIDGAKTRGYFLARDDVLEVEIALIFPMKSLMV